MTLTFWCWKGTQEVVEVAGYYAIGDMRIAVVEAADGGLWTVPVEALAVTA